MASGESVAVPNPSRRILDEGALAGVGDGQLLRRFTADRDELAEIAFAALVHRHGPMVWRVCRQVVGDPHTAEDAFQAAFLVLARRAGSIGRPDLLGNWLHGVALRTAREARSRDDRRRRREPSGRLDACEEPIGDVARPDAALIRREQFEALHEEVSRLPERYRAPVVLCELEGLTYQEAAIRLRCPVGTIGVRLRRARQRLRGRLTRRGLAPTTALFGAILGARTATAWIPRALAESTIQAAAPFAASEAAAIDLVSARVVGLTETVLRTMVMKRLKTAVRLAFALGLGAGIGWVAVHRAPRSFVSNRQASAAGKAEAGAPRAQAPPIVADQAVPETGARAGGKVTPVALKIPASPVVDAPSEPAPDRAKPAPLAAALLMTEEQTRGAVLFTREWVANDPMSRGGDGLGPVYNETSCIACHGLGAPGGAGPEGKNVVLVSATSRDKEVARLLEEIHPAFHGSRSIVLHRFGTDPAYGSWRQSFYESQFDPRARRSNTAKARIRELRERTSLFVRARDRSVIVSPSHEVALRLSERNPPALFGAGQIDKIPTAILVDLAASQPMKIRGRINRDREGRVGRFGWKAQVASLHEFVRAACANELGLEVPGHHQASTPLAPEEKAPGLDLTDRDCDALVAYVRNLPAPVVLDPAGPQGSLKQQEGRRLFAEIGCAGCHTPSLGSVRGIYSDLLLHSMGDTLDDSGTSYGSQDHDSPRGPRPSEWRTPPLWGFRDSGPYLHDGRAQTLEEAVALHSGQGALSAQQYFSRSDEERTQVEAFLKSLVAPSAAAAPGVILACEMELRLQDEEHHEEQKQRELREQKLAEAAAQRARLQILAAQDLEKMSKWAGALDFYREIARTVPQTPEGQLASQRIELLRRRLEAQ